MSGLIGKKGSTLKKEQVKESKLITTGVKSIKFWHEASAGETNIPFDALVLPTSIAENGLTNPTTTKILSANLALFSANVEVFSSLNQKLMEGLTYVVRNSQIKFVNGYTAAEGEIFEVCFKNEVITGTNVVDARPLTATGLLLAGDVDFNVGETFKTNANPASQLGEVLVFVDGALQFRNVDNATANPGADGNYEEVHSLNGFGTIIRFNDVSVSDRNIIVVSRNLIAERPDISMMQLIENLGGQLDAVIETLAAVAGVPETDFQTAPNQVDLRAFGDAVTSNKKRITALEEEAKVVLSNKTGYGAFGVKRIANFSTVESVGTALSKITHTGSTGDAIKVLKRGVYRVTGNYNLSGGGTAEYWGVFKNPDSTTLTYNSTYPQLVAGSSSISPYNCTIGDTLVLEINDEIVLAENYTRANSPQSFLKVELVKLLP